MRAVRILAVVAALGATAALPLGCSSQIVDAVDLVPTRDAGAPACPDGGEAMDSDGDGVPDCEDLCRDDPEKTVPGTCGCDLSDPQPQVPDGGKTCLDLEELLVHRYTFIGRSGSLAVLDSVRGDDGEVVGTTLPGDGTLPLDGASDQYVNLPNGLLSQHQSVTLEAWIRWNGGNAWQRIFDFGNNDSATEDAQGSLGTSYLFLTPRTQTDALRLQGSKLRLAYKAPPAVPRELIVEASVALPSGVSVETHVAAVIDAEAKTMSLYVNGERQHGRAMIAGVVTRDSPTSPEYVSVPYVVVNEAGPYDWGTPLPDGSLPPAVDLGAIDDVNAWLGRSQFFRDAPLGAVLYEFRIYAGALSEELVHISKRAGPDPVFLPEPTPAGN